MNRHLLNLKSLFVVIIAINILSACSKKEEEKPSNQVVGTWTLSTVDATINGQSIVDYFVSIGLPQAQADQYSSELQQSFTGTVVVKSDNTYQFNIGDSPSSGTWSINSAGDKLTFTPDSGAAVVADILSLDSHNLHIKFSEDIPEDTNGDGTPDITLTLTLDMKLTK